MEWDFDMRMKEEWDGSMDHRRYQCAVENRLVDHSELVRVWMGACDYRQRDVVLPLVDYFVL